MRPEQVQAIEANPNRAVSERGGFLLAEHRLMHFEDFGRVRVSLLCGGIERLQFCLRRFTRRQKTLSLARGIVPPLFAQPH